MTPELVTGRTYRFDEKTKQLVTVCEYAYVCSGATIWDAELIAWAENRAAELKRRQA